MRKILSVIYIFISYYAFAQISENVNTLISKLSNVEKGNLAIINYPGRENEIDKIYLKIKNIASKREIEYLAFYGTTNCKYYFSKALIDHRSKKLPKLYEHYIGQSDSIQFKYSCVINTFNLANDLYQEIYNKSKYIKEAKEYKLIYKSKIYRNSEEIEKDLKERSNYHTNWTINSVKKMIKNFDMMALENPKTPKANNRIYLFNKSIQ